MINNNPIIHCNFYQFSLTSVDHEPCKECLEGRTFNPTYKKFKVLNKDLFMASVLTYWENVAEYKPE